jgi:hypothetical protein
MPHAKMGLYTTDLYVLHPMYKFPSEDQITVIIRSRETDFHTTKKRSKVNISWIFKVS